MRCQAGPYLQHSRSARSASRRGLSVGVDVVGEGGPLDDPSDHAGLDDAADEVDVRLALGVRQGGNSVDGSGRPAGGQHR